VAWKRLTAIYGRLARIGEKSALALFLIVAISAAGLSLSQLLDR
jgi:hypothetical protein